MKIVRIVDVTHILKPWKVVLRKIVAVYEEKHSATEGMCYTWMLSPKDLRLDLSSPFGGDLIMTCSHKELVDILKILEEKGYITITKGKRGGIEWVTFLFNKINKDKSL